MPREADPARDPAYLEDMLQAALAVQSFVKERTREDYLGDALLRSAVERQVEIIGEAVRKVSRQTCDAHPEIPWSAIRAQRHRLAHDYDQINDEIIWAVAAVHVPALIGHLRRIIPPA